MTKIGLLSDTHCVIDSKMLEFFKDCDQIWHAGDIGNLETADKLAAFKPLKAVFGNIDGHDLRCVYKEHCRFVCEGVDVWITHIGGYPDHYDRSVRKEIYANPPRLFICGHSHILKVMFDKKIDCLHINPGAAGNSGWHKVKTALRFDIDKTEIKNLEILELKRL